MINGKEERERLVFFFDNTTCNGRTRHPDKIFFNKIRMFLNGLEPFKVWEERGIYNKKILRNLYPDFVIILDNKIIACEYELHNISEKIFIYDGIDIFDEIWFFTNIGHRQEHLFYKFKNSLNIPTKFFGIDEKGGIIQIGT